jgi:lipid II:glycine glycyltransferase (peptidoglycan interpeptide bridge formation enzyme)
MQMQLREVDEAEVWDRYVAEHPWGHPLQLWGWGEAKRGNQWTPHRLVLADGERWVAAAQVLLWPIPRLGRFIAYVPRGPVVEPGSREARALLEGVVAWAKERRALYVRLEPVEATGANLETMFELMKATEARAQYGLRPAAYFKDYWTAQIAAGQAQLLFARHEGEVLAGIFVTYVGKRAWYKDGGSFDVKRELNASYLLQWETMRWLMARGIEHYDLVGSPNRDELDRPNSRAGLYEFKRKFNPEVTEFVGCWDLPLSSAKYKFWRQVGERVAARLVRRRPEKFLY